MPTDEVRIGEEQTPSTGSPTPTHNPLVHPQAAVLFHRVPCMQHIPVLGIAVEAYGPKLISSLCISYFLCKGTADQIIGFSRQPMLRRRFGLSATRYQRLASIWATGWSIKAFIALLTDTFAFLGYTKRWYMLISCVGGAAFALGYGLLPAKPSSANIAAGFIFLTTLGKSNVDILSEGHYSRLIRRNPVPGPALVSCIWVCILMGTLIASVIQGPLSDSNMMQVGVFISAALQLVTCIFFVFNWYGEGTNREERMQDRLDMRVALARARAKDEAAAATTEAEMHAPGIKKEELHPELSSSVEDRTKGTPNNNANTPPQEEVLDDGIVVAADLDVARGEHEEDEEEEIPTCLCGVFEVNKEVILRNWKVVAYCVIMTCSVVSMVCVTILGTTWDLMYACIVISVVCCGVAFFALPLVIAKAQVFGYANSLLYIQLPGALDNFYLADEACVPGGPHFSYSFYNTISAVIGNIGGMVGVAMFTYVFSKMNYQVVMCVTVSLMILSSLFDLIMVERWNLAIGIPDHALYIFGDAVIFQVVNMLVSMPTMILTARLCPRGSESMVYALMAGFSNLGQTMSGAIGSLLMETRLPINTDITPCDFTNVRWLVITGHLCCPVLILPLAFLLLPRVRICDDIDVNGHAIKAQMAAERKKKEKEESEEQPEQPQDTTSVSEPCQDVSDAPNGVART